MTALKIVIIVAVGYLIGCLSTAYIVGKLFGNVDIRQHGSGSLGATNMVRVKGWKYGLFTLLGDASKGAVASALGWLILGSVDGAAIGGVAAIVGHNWPVFLNFKGGKGVAATLGSILVVNWWVGLVMIALAVLIIAVTRYVSVGSMVGGAGVAVFMACLYWGSDWVLVAYGLIVGLMIILVHHANIGRLLHGSENKLSFGKKR